MKTIHYILCFIILTFSNAFYCQTDSIAKIFIQTPPNGVFYSFGDFKNGVISMKDSVTTTSIPRKQKIWKGTESVKPRNSQHKREKRIKGLWGFADGKNIYVWNEMDFFPLILREDKIGFEGYAPYNYSYNPGAHATVAVLFGGIGAVAYAAAKESKAKSAKEFYWFNFENETRHAYNNYKVVEFMDNLSCRVIFYRRSKKESMEEIKLVVNEDQTLEFLPDSYKTMRIRESRLLKVCLLNNETNCMIFDLKDDKKAYIKVSEFKGTDKILFEKVSVSQGEFESVKPKKEEDKRW